MWIEAAVAYFKYDINIILGVQRKGTKVIANTFGLWAKNPTQRLLNRTGMLTTDLHRSVKAGKDGERRGLVTILDTIIFYSATDMTNLNSER